MNEKSKQSLKLNRMNLPISNWPIKRKKFFFNGSVQLIVQVVWVSIESGWRGLQDSISQSLNKDQQPPIRHRANLSPPGHEKSAQLNKRATERAPGARRNCRKRGHLSSKLPPDRCPPSLPHSRLCRGLSWAAEHKRTGCEAAREAGSLQESAVALGEGVVPETRRPERHRGVSPPSPCWTRAENWSRAPHSPSPTRSRKLNPSHDLPAATKL